LIALSTSHSRLDEKRLHVAIRWRRLRPRCNSAAGTAIRCDHAGLLLLFPAMVTLRLPELIGACGYPSTSQLSSWQSLAALLLAKCGRISRIHHISAFTDDLGLGFALGLTALPKATHLTSYSYRVRRDANLKLQQLLIGELRNHELATGTAGFNLDFHAIRHHGADAVLEEHYVPARSQRTRSVLTFFAQDHASTEMVYANADLTKAEQPQEIIAFADYWHDVTGTDPGLLVFDSQLTTYAVLDELSTHGITWLTLRKRGPKVLADLAALPASAWQHAEIKRAGSYRRPHLHEDLITLKGIHAPIRQIAVKNIGRPEPTLLITGDHTTLAIDLFARYAERMIIENELNAYIGGFHLNALSSGVPLNVDLDTTLTVLAGNLYRLLARGLNRYETATPDTIWRHFLDATGTLHVTDDHVTCALNLRSNHPRSHPGRLRRPRPGNPLVGRTNPPLHLPAALTGPPAINRRQQPAPTLATRTASTPGPAPTSTQLRHRRSRLIDRSAAPGRVAYLPWIPTGLVGQSMGQAAKENLPTAARSCVCAGRCRPSGAK
jgi:hypothetical protein